MSSDGRFEVPGEAIFARDPVFSGTKGQFKRGFATLEGAQTFVEALTNGDFDPFFAEAWFLAEIRRNRDPITGQFITDPAWWVFVDFQRPAPEEDYVLDVGG